MKQFINRVKQISILILTISLFGCTSDDAEEGNRWIYPHSLGTVTFLNTSENAKLCLGFGDKTTSIEIDPIKTYAGKYTVVLTAKK
jgi:hypothetical protein